MGYNVQWSTDFRIFEIICVNFVLAICDIVHDMETLFYFPKPHDVEECSISKCNSLGNTPILDISDIVL